VTLAVASPHAAAGAPTGGLGGGGVDGGAPRQWRHVLSPGLPTGGELNNHRCLGALDRVLPDRVSPLLPLSCFAFLLLHHTEILLSRLVISIMCQTKRITVLIFISY
jgi:hypothetical protein